MPKYRFQGKCTFDFDVEVEGLDIDAAESRLLDWYSAGYLLDQMGHPFAGLDPTYMIEEVEEVVNIQG